jgi:hypothetical protein
VIEVPTPLGFSQSVKKEVVLLVLNFPDTMFYKDNARAILVLAQNTWVLEFVHGPEF